MCMWTIFAVSDELGLEVHPSAVMIIHLKLEFSD